MTDTISKTADVVQVTDDTPQIDHPEATAASWAAMPLAASSAGRECLDVTTPPPTRMYPDKVAVLSSVMALTSAQRAAQRSLVGLVRVGSAVVSRRDGLCIWRAEGSEEWQVGAGEIAEHLDVLEVPYSVAIVVRPARGTRRRQAGWEIRVAWDQMDAITHWVPSLRRLMAAVEDDSIDVPAT